VSSHEVVNFIAVDYGRDNSVDDEESGEDGVEEVLHFLVIVYGFLFWKFNRYHISVCLFVDGRLGVRLSF